MHQVTAFGGAKPAPFQQAVIQSPGFKPTVSALDQEKTLGAFLYLLNVSSIEEARKLPSDTLQGANIIQTGLAAYGKFTWGPVVDGIIAPQLPGQLLAKGQFVKELKVMVGHNTNEGLLFTSPFAQDEAAYQNQVLGLQSSLAAYPEVIDYISTKLYPNDAYPDQIARAAATVADSGFVCNTYYLDKAFGNQTYAYLFAVPPGLHGDDIEYTFNNDDALLAPQIADALQEYITHFAEFGTPSEKGVPYFPLYGNNATVQVLNVTGITQARDPAANERCNWWQKALYY
jgi:carboxylesterase type B